MNWCSVFDYLFTLLSCIGISRPVFWFGATPVLFLSIQLVWFPVGAMDAAGGSTAFWDSAHHLVLVVIVLALVFIAAWRCYLHSSLLEVLRYDSLRTTRAKRATATPE